MPPSRPEPAGGGVERPQSTCGAHGFVGPPLLPAGGRLAYELA
jgi:hypothetical protein